jgi:hypothetical protein
MSRIQSDGQFAIDREEKKKGIYPIHHYFHLRISMSTLATTTTQSNFVFESIHHSAWLAAFGQCRTFTESQMFLKDEEIGKQTAAPSFSDILMPRGWSALFASIDGAPRQSGSKVALHNQLGFTHSTA